MADSPTTADCYCCGRSLAEDDLARLACHDEVALCGGCIGWLAGQVSSVTRAVPVLRSPSLEAHSSFWSAAGFDVELHIRPGLPHSIDEQGLILGVNFLRKVLGN